MTLTQSETESLIRKAVEGRIRTIDEFQRLVEATEGLIDFDELLPTILDLDGKPMNVVDRRPMFRPLFKRVRQARREVYICGRQLGKSASAAASMVMNLNMRRGFRIMYVAPLALYVNRMHHQYMGIMQTSCKLPWKIQDGKCVNNVTEKSFLSGSHYYGASCFNSPRAVLGATCDALYYDECSRGCTLISGEHSAEMLVDKKPGDRILAFDTNLSVTYDRIKSLTHKGKRHVWRLLLQNGTHLDCTGNERIMSDRGWFYLADILPQSEADRCPRTRQAKAARQATDSNGARDAAGRLMPLDGEQHRLYSLSEILRDTRGMSGHLLPQQGGSAGGSGEDTAEDCREQGLGGEKLRFYKPDQSGVRVFAPRLLHRPVQEGTSGQEGDPAVGGPSGLGSDSLVVDGRRELGGHGKGGSVQHSELLGERSLAAGSMAERPRGEVQQAQGAEKEAGRSSPALLDHQRACGWHSAPAGQYPGIQSSGDGLQVGVQGHRDSGTVPLLPSSLCSGVARDVRHVLPITIVSEAGLQGDQESLCGGESTDAQSENFSPIPCGPRSFPAEMSGESSGPNGEAWVSREVEFQATQASTVGSNLLPVRDGLSGGWQYVEDDAVLPVAGVSISNRGLAAHPSQSGSWLETRQGIDLSLLRQDVSEQAEHIHSVSALSVEGLPSAILSGLPSTQGCETDGSGTSSVGESDGDFVAIAGIAYLGEDDVYDIETENHHTFFANGIGVHNCQDLNVEFIPQIREILGTSDYRWETFTGTARTLDNTLQVLFDQSSQNEWHMRCRKCGYVNIPIGDDALKMIQPQGIGCARCSTHARFRPLDVSDGWWKPMFKERDKLFRGFHVPQTIVVDRITPHDRYVDTIYNKLHGVERYSLAKFQQEVLGISSEQGARPLTVQQIRDASSVVTPHRIEEYSHIAGGADWGGSEITSFTVGTLVGLHHTGVFHCLGALRPTGIQDNFRHLPIAAYFKRMGGSRLVALGADGGFVGSVQNKNLGSATGVPCASILYGTKKNFFQASGGHFNIFTVDRSTLIYIVFSMIAEGKLRLPSDPAFQVFWDDLMAVSAADIETPSGTIRRYQRMATKADDFLHALGYALFVCSLMCGRDLPSMIGMENNSSVNSRLVTDVGGRPIIGEEQGVTYTEGGVLV